MAQKLVVGPFNKGLRNDVTPFNIDNESFPTLINAYQWRGRVKRKRGTSLLGILQRFFESSSVSYGSIGTINLVAGSANLLTGFSLQANGNIVPGTVIIGDVTAGQSYTDPLKNGTLQGNLGGSGTINYATGVITIVGGAGDTINTLFVYNPSLPVMGLKDFFINSFQYPGTIAFDTTYSYNITTSLTPLIYDVSFYKNPSTGSYPGYVQKATWAPTTWNGTTYQQFWTTNYQGAMWATNGIDIPFTGGTIGMQFAPASTITYNNNTATTINITITNSPLIIGDFVFFNEWTGANAASLNLQTGYVTAAAPNTPALANKTLTITFPNPNGTTLGAGPYAPGIIQYLTNRSNIAVDNIRWYDGDPTNGSPTAPVFETGSGWVNFMPPLSNLPFSIGDLPPAIYYLVGCRMIVPFKDRLCFFGPVVQTSTGAPIYLQDTVVYSQNGTPFYTAGFSGSVFTPTNGFVFPVLVPINQIATANAYFEDSTGYGGFQTVGVDQPITTVAHNQDVLMVGFPTLQTKMVYTGNDVIPFNFYITNSELGSGSTFSAITLDQGVMSRGNRGFVISNQVGTERFDLEIPDEVFEIGLLNNGAERVTAQRDFVNEWVYFTYMLGDEESDYNYPNTTLQYNYRDNSWAVFYETYTTYGQFRPSTGLTWATVGNTYPTWAQWNDPWNSGTSTTLQTRIIGGNQQGFVIIRAQGTGESVSLTIQSITGNTVTSIDHTLSEGDYILISGVLGTIGYFLNGQIFSVGVTTENTFTLNGNPIGTGSYFGGGQIKKMYVPLIQTKQFPAAWEMGRKTRIGTQQYLLTTTDDSQIQLQIYLSQNEDVAYNLGPIVPTAQSINNSLVYSTVLYTCPESTNLGLSPANTNLQMPTATQQAQIWHRMNTSLIGDTVQLGFTMSDDQMRSLTPGFSSMENESSETFRITGASQALPCVLNCNGAFEAGEIIMINDVVGMTQLNGHNYSVISSTTTTVTIEVDSTNFFKYLRGGNATLVEIVTYSITGATAANPSVLSSVAQYSAGQLITINGVLGMTQLNGNTYVVLSSTPTTVTIGVDATGFSAYIIGGFTTAVTPINQFAEIELHGFIIDLTASQLLS